MNRIAILLIASLSMIVVLAAGCSSGTNINNTTTAGNARPATNTNAPATNAVPAKDETPAQVKAAFSGAQSFTTQHKDIPQNAMADIEKDTGGKVPDTDHHSYLAFSTEGGTRKQLGAATLVKAGGKDIVIVYENRGGSPYIKEVRAEGVPAEFLAQFGGKGHDDKFSVGSDIKVIGVDDATAKAIALAVRIDAITMQTLYGASHSH